MLSQLLQQLGLIAKIVLASDGNTYCIVSRRSRLHSRRHDHRPRALVCTSHWHKKTYRCHTLYKNLIKLKLKQKTEIVLKQHVHNLYTQVL